MFSSLFGLVASTMGAKDPDRNDVRTTRNPTALFPTILEREARVERG
jgi:hypothetical protein